jgi:nucleoside-diphosphate-sugar epimerase
MLNLSYKRRSTANTDVSFIPNNKQEFRWIADQSSAMTGREDATYHLAAPVDGQALQEAGSG